MSDRPDLTARYGTVDRAYGRRLATTPPELDGPVWMINLLAYRAQAEYADGRASSASGREADDAYAPLESLAAVGAEVALFADVDTQLLGDSPRWDRVGVVRYPTRRSFIEMQSRPDFVTQHAHKDAGVSQTIVLGGQPLPTPTVPEGAPAWADVPHPPTVDDGPVLLVHVLRFHEGAAGESMAGYQDEAGEVAIPHGVRIAAWFAVEGTIVGDGRQWDQVRFNAFPSKAAFMAVALDPRRLAAQRQHREPAIADTYTMILRPTIDRLTVSAASR